MSNDIIILVKTTATVDDCGDTILTEEYKEVFAELKSISQSEFYQAQAVGVKPEIKFLITDYYDYDNEQLINYESERYKVIRTYRIGHGLEIVCKRGVEE